MIWKIVVAVFLFYGPGNEQKVKDLWLEPEFKTQAACVAFLPRAPQVFVNQYEDEIKRLRHIIRADASCKIEEE